jgi:hypothetical protein
MCIDSCSAVGDGVDCIYAYRTMQKATEYKVEDSNVENIGSAEDKAARLAAAQTEKEWCAFADCWGPVEMTGSGALARTAVRWRAIGGSRNALAPCGI